MKSSIQRGLRLAFEGQSYVLDYHLEQSGTNGPDQLILRNYTFSAANDEAALDLALRRLKRELGVISKMRLGVVTIAPDLNPIPGDRLYRLKFMYLDVANRAALLKTSDPHTCFVKGYGAAQADQLKAQ